MISKSFSSFLALSVGLYFVFGRSFFPYIAGLFLILFFLTEKRYRWIYITWKTLPRDLFAVYRFTLLNIKLLYWERNKINVIDAFRQNVQKQPEKIAFFFEDKTWTFKQVDDYSDKVAALFLSKGLKRGQCVALYMENRPEYVGIWIGAAKIGCSTALININLVKKPLEHCLKAANSSLILFSAELQTAILDLNWKETPLLRLDLEGKAAEFPANVNNATDITKSLKEIAPLPENQRYHASLTDTLIYIYTSGTTGLPKAAVIKHTRFMFMQWGVKSLLGVRDEDRLYTCLPFYHSAGGILGVGQVIIGGSSMAIRRKFSVTNFWKDCVKYDCTVGQYIGEISRYLLSGKPCDEERQHRMRLIYGNGMRPQIWKQFVTRFGVKQVGEFYGSTEGNSNLVNIDGKAGAVGFIPRLAVRFYPVSLIRVDEHTLEPIRGPDGLCIRCQPDEPGIFVGKINTKKSYQDFEGYADKNASEKKILQNVFTHGDSFFNSGDVLVMDELGYYYFRDRKGDTFRWRGENVSTAEVEAVISNIISLKDTVVYGVEIPNVEGRAGMAAIVDPQNSLDLAALAEGVRSELPSYSRPLFIRVMAELPMTSTFKMKKMDLQEEGFNIHKVQDPLYYLNARGVYEPITNEIYGDIISGKIRL